MADGLHAVEQTRANSGAPRETRKPQGANATAQVTTFPFSLPGRLSSTAGLGGDMNIAPISEFSRLCHLAPDCEPEWDSITKEHRNVLIEGPRAAIDPAILLFVPYLSEPIAWRRPGEPFEFDAGPCRTLIVDDVGALDAEEQTRLCGWLDSARRHVQVVSTNRKPLFPLVRRGLFDQRLYYRLNVMLVQCRALAALSGGLTSTGEDRFRRKAHH